MNLILCLNLSLHVCSFHWLKSNKLKTVHFYFFNLVDVFPFTMHNLYENRYVYYDYG